MSDAIGVSFRNSLLSHLVLAAGQNRPCFLIKKDGGGKNCFHLQCSDSLEDCILEEPRERRSLERDVVVMMMVVVMVVVG